MNQQPEENPKTPKASKGAKVASYDIARADETLSLATDLAKFIRENKLTHNVQGKEYVNVEGWQYAGSRLGIVPIVEQVLDMSHDGEIKYNAKVNLFDLRSQQIVGAGFAVCSNKENGKKFYAEYAIASMAQTRAIGKAYRNILAWIIRAAGYEPTPAEEMDYQTLPQPGMAAIGAPRAATQPLMQVSAPAPAGESRPESFDDAPEVRYASARQKEEIIRLLNNPVITRAEKTKMLLSINKLDEARAAQSVEKLRQAILERESTPSIAA